MYEVFNPVLWVDSNLGFGHWLRLDLLAFWVAYFPAKAASLLGIGFLFAPIWLVLLALVARVAVIPARRCLASVLVSIVLAHALGISVHSILLRRSGRAAMKGKQDLAVAYLRRADSMSDKLLGSRGMKWAASMVDPRFLIGPEANSRSETRLTADADPGADPNASKAVEPASAESTGHPDETTSTGATIVGAWRLDRSATLEALIKSGHVSRRDGAGGGYDWATPRLQATFDLFRDGIFDFEPAGGVWLEKRGRRVPAGHWSRRENGYFLDAGTDNPNEGTKLTLWAGRLDLHDPSGVVFVYSRK